MTLEEIRAMKGGTIQETLLLENAAQVAELNILVKELIKEFREDKTKVATHYNITSHIPDEKATQVRKAIERTPLAKVE